MSDQPAISSAAGVANLQEQTGPRAAAKPSGAVGYLLPDHEPPPWNPEQDLYRRWRRRVRCAADGAEG